MLGHERKIIGFRSKGRDGPLQASRPIKEMIVVETDMCDAVLPEDAYHAICQCCFARTAVTTDCHYERLESSCHSLHRLKLSSIVFAVGFCQNHTRYLSEQSTQKCCSLRRLQAKTFGTYKYSRGKRLSTIDHPLSYHSQIHVRSRIS